MTSQVPADIPEAREELDRIICSRAFRDAKPCSSLLKYLVQRTLDGTADDLKEYVIGVDVFGKPNGYDPQTDASVRVQIGKLRRKLEEYYLDEGVADTLLLQLPKRHFAVLFERRTAVRPLRSRFRVPAAAAPGSYGRVCCPGRWRPSSQGGPCF